MSKNVIVAKNISKDFLLPHQKKSNLKDHIIHPLSREEKEKQQALHDISFSIEKGEFFGIVGRNGSGKSTLLKILAGVYTPTSGSISVEGNLVPFIELGVGFNPELSGRDNVYLNGSLLGFSRQEMAEMYDEIVEFAELERFMDQKLKNYSSGMQVRLAFSIAIRAKADILLIDEVLAVGDEAFQKKCVDVLRRIREDESKTVVLVTHDMSWIEKFCDRAAVIEKGKLMAVYDNAYEAKNHYSQLNVEHQGDDTVASKRWGGGEITIDNVDLYQQKQAVESQVQCEQELTLSLDLTNHNLNRKDPILIGVGFYTETGQQVFGPNSEGVGITAAKKHVTFTIPALTFNEGRFFLSVGVFDKSGNTVYDFQDKMMEFKVVRGEQSKQVGLAYLDGKWSYDGK